MKAVCFMCLRVVYVHTSVHMLAMHAMCISLFLSLCVCGVRVCLHVFVCM